MLLKSKFLAFKKSCTSCVNGGGLLLLFINLKKFANRLIWNLRSACFWVGTRMIFAKRSVAQCIWLKTYQWDTYKNIVCVTICVQYSSNILIDKIASHLDSLQTGSSSRPGYFVPEILEFDKRLGIFWQATNILTPQQYFDTFH